MALSVAIVGEGLHHAVASGNITVGGDFGEVPATGIAQPMSLRLPFDSRVYVPEGFEDQFYIIAKSLDGSVSDVRLAPTAFTNDGVSPILHLLVDLTAAPAAMSIWLEAHHSIGR